MKHKLLTLSLLASVAVLAGCAHKDGDYIYEPGNGVNEKVRVPTGHKFTKVYTGSGVLHYECKASGAKGEWTFKPEANLYVVGTAMGSGTSQNRVMQGGDSGGEPELAAGAHAPMSSMGSGVKYYAGPTWESMSDGSVLTGSQVAAATNGNGNLPLQLIRVDNTKNYGKTGEMIGYTYVQRLNTKGGVAPTQSCNLGTNGQKIDVPYSADYIFYRPV